jgi:hypothetical protein
MPIYEEDEDEYQYDEDENFDCLEDRLDYLFQIADKNKGDKHV